MAYQTKFSLNSFSVIVWALIATLQSLVSDKHGFYATRVLLGLAESGFIPGAVYYLGTFYTKKQFVSRAAWLWMGNTIAKGCSGLFASGILGLAGKNGRAGWQWLFMSKSAGSGSVVRIVELKNTIS